MSVDVINPLVEKPRTSSVEEAPALELNYQILLQIFIAVALMQLARSSQINSVQTERKKHTYTQANMEWAQYQRSLGNIGVYSTAATVMIFGASVLLKTPIPDVLAQKGPDSLANIFSARTQSKQRMADSVSALAMNDINAAANKVGNESTAKDQLTRLLEQVYEAQRRAAQAG